MLCTFMFIADLYRGNTLCCAGRLSIWLGFYINADSAPLFHRTHPKISLKAKFYVLHCCLGSSVIDKAQQKLFQRADS
ncbi:hypothetical protein XELAEV_18023176mg [Xenopus laevis]|uniref:Uncharacterized protein n=1 Tax=Xenopus laevis TaxID=8355 RepID=A0A974D5K8_XENLA|nr:hypothetical protein XELAEV_18023176mg [Xenopus laevis]